MNGVKRVMCFGLVLLCSGLVICFAAEQVTTDSTEVAAKIKAEGDELVEQLDLPEDTTPLLSVRELRISGNSLIPTAELLENMPLVYNVSDKPLHQAESDNLYDFRILHYIILEPGQPHQVSTRTVKGFTQYILSVYQQRGYAGIYVYVPADAIKDGRKLQDELLAIEIIEAKVAEIKITPYNSEHEQVEKGILRRSVIRKWSPAKAGQVVNQKKLDDFVNLLNLNPDRYVSVVVSRGAEPNSLGLAYDIYEAKPWHYFIQIDDSGTRERQWAPRIGIINTNLTGIDDRLTTVYQVAVDSADENYSLFGSYDFPILGPKLRLSLYAGYSEFDIEPEGGAGFNFLGNGSFYGSILRYNAYQSDGWFFDVTGSLSHERSKITPELFPSMASDVKMDLLGVGFDIYRSTDTSNTSFAFNRVESIGGSGRGEFSLARLDADRDFTIYTTSANHSQYIDPNKIQRLSGSLRTINSNGRLVPAKMTTFGGLYSVRGYKEDEIVADGGMLLSAQYEFDLVKYKQSKENRQGSSNQSPAKKEKLRKLALLGFIDYGRAKIKDHVAGENGTEKLLGMGLGTAVKVGEHFDGAVYYGWPLRSTDDTKEGKGRLNVSLMLKW